MKVKYLAAAALLAVSSTAIYANNKCPDENTCPPNADFTGTYEGSQICPGLYCKGFASDNTDTNASRLFVKHHVPSGKVQVFAEFFTTGYNGFLVQSRTEKCAVGMAVASCNTDQKLKGFINEVLVGRFNINIDGNLQFNGHSTLGGTETADDFERAGGNFLQECEWSYTRVDAAIPEDILPLFEGNICKNVTTG